MEDPTVATEDPLLFPNMHPTSQAPSISHGSLNKLLDLTDLPADVLGLIFSQLPTGHRLDLRAVNRNWASWVDSCLVASTHLNLVMDIQALQGAARDAVRKQSSSTLQHGNCAMSSAHGAGLLAARFPTARAVRLWVGCRPPASLAGLNGGGADAATLYGTLFRQHRTVTELAAAARSRTAHKWLQRTSQALLEVRASALRTATSSLAVVSASISEATQAILEYAGQCCLLRCVPVLGRHQPHLQQPRRRLRDQLTAAPRWHVHQQTTGTRAVPSLRRYAPEVPEAALKPLSVCLPLLGSSHRLTRLSLVTAHDVTLQDLDLLASAFPNLTALALHAHQGLFLDTVPVEIPSLAPLLTSAAGAPLPSTDSHVHASAVQSPPDEAATISAIQPPPDNAAGSSSDTVPTSSAAAGGTAASDCEGPLRNSHSLTFTLGGGGGGSTSAIASNSAGDGKGASNRNGRFRRSGIASAISDPVVAQFRTPPAQPPPPLPLPPTLRLQSLELCGLRCGWPDEGGLQHLKSLRSLVLQRTVCRMHRVMPQIKALTQLTRLELRRLDYHHSMPMDIQDMIQLQWKNRRRWDREKLREQQRQQRVRDPSSGPHGDGAAVTMLWTLTEEMSEESGSEVEDADEEFGLETAPWLMAQRGAPTRIVPDWRRTILALARAVRGMRGLQVLVCDAESPESGAWSSLESALSRLPGLRELRLPYMAVADPAKLAVTLPQLHSLELGWLPLQNPLGCAFVQPESIIRELGTLNQLQGPAQGEGEPRLGRCCIPEPCFLQRQYMLPALAALARAGGDGGFGFSGCQGGSDSGNVSGFGAASETGGGCRHNQAQAPCEVSPSGVESGSNGGGHCGLGAGEGGGLSGFSQLRELVLHHTGLRVLATQWLPLPPRLQRLEMPLQHAFKREEKHIPIDVEDLLLLHGALLPAMARVPSVGLTLGIIVPQFRQLLVAMLSYWLSWRLVSLDLTALTHPNIGVDEADALACLRLVASGLPRVRRLSCCLWAGCCGPMRADPAEGCSGGRPGIGGDSGGPGGGGGDGGVRECEGAGRGRSPWGWTAVDCINELGELEELRVKVLASCSPGARFTHQAARVPLGLLRAMRRPLRVLDCAPLDVWCCDDGSIHPRQALNEARALLAAEGCCCLLVSEEAEEWSAGAMGLGPELEAVWRREGMLS